MTLPTDLEEAHRPAVLVRLAHLLAAVQGKRVQPLGEASELRLRFQLARVNLHQTRSVYSQPHHAKYGCNGTTIIIIMYDLFYRKLQWLKLELIE